MIEKARMPKTLYANTKKNKRGKAELTDRLTMRINAKTLREIDEFCKRNRIPKSNLYRYCLQEGFAALKARNIADKSE